MPKTPISSETVKTIKHALTEAKLIYAKRQNRDLSKSLLQSQRTLQHYQNIVEGRNILHSLPRHSGKLALPPQPKMRGRYVHKIWPCHITVSRPKIVPQRPVAAHETASASGEPTIKGGDGGRFVFRGRARRSYNLLNDTGLQINARFKTRPNGGTAIGNVGVTVTGHGGYSRVEISTRNGLGVQATVNGRLLNPGQSTRLADGGTLHVSQDAKSAFIRSREGYRTHVIAKGHGLHSTLNVSIQSPRQGVAGDGRIPGGLLGHTFDRGKAPRNSAKERYANYEVIGGLFGRPKPKIVNGQLHRIQRPIGPAYKQYFKLNPDKKFSDLGQGEIKALWRQLTDQMAKSHLIQDAWTRQNEMQQKSRKIELLLMAALNSGNMDMAVLMLSSIETKMANDATRGLVGQIHSLQQQRQSLSSQMTQVGASDDAKGASQLRSLATQAEGIGTEISLLQTFLQDAMASKRNTQEFASNWIRQSHETARSIIQNIGR